MKIYIIVAKREKKEREPEVFMSNDFCNRAAAAAAGRSPLGDLVHAIPPVLLNHL